MKKQLLTLILSLSCLTKTISLYSKAKITIRKGIKEFLQCGLLGWCIEIIYTAFNALRRRDMTLTGHTSIWMFPIYGCAVFIKPLSHAIRGKSIFLRGCFYACWIYIVEFISGCFLMRKNACPWNYHTSKWQIHDVIRLDFAPFWFIVGLFFEFILNRKESRTA